MQAALFLDISQKTLATSETGSSFSWPKIPAGDNIRLKLRLTDTVNGSRIRSGREISAMKLSIGRQDARPASGTFQLKLGAGAESAGVNTTAALQWNCAAADMQEALNALSDAGLAGLKPFAVTLRDGSYHIRAAAGASVTFTVADNALLPSSVIRIRDYAFDEATSYELRMIQAPVAEASAFENIVPELPSVSVVYAGTTESGIKRNTVQKIYFPPELDAEYSFRIRWGFRRTDVLALPTDADSIAEALNAVAEEGEEVVAVAGENHVLVEFRGDLLAGTSVAALVLEAVTSPSARQVIDCATLTDEMAQHIASVANAASGITEFKLPLHLQITLIDEQDDEATEVISLIQEITFQKPVSMDVFANAPTLNPAHPLSRTSYLAFTPSQVTETQRGYLLTGATALGDGVADEFEITHNLGTRHVYVALFDSAVDGQQLVHGTDYDVEIVSDNAIKIIFAVAPANDGVVGGICTVASTNAFVDLEINASQVIGLEDWMADIEAAIAELQANHAAGSSGTRDPAAGSKLMEIVLPKFIDAYPMKTSILAAAQAAAPLANQSVTQTANVSPTGTTSATVTTGQPQTAEIKGIAEIKPEFLPGDGDLIGAIHDATLETLSAAPPTASAANAGKVWQNRTASSIRISGGGGRSSSMAKPGEFAASDGRRVYPVINPTVDAARVFTADAGTDVITLALHGYIADQKVRVFSTTTLPAGLSADTDYFVRDVTADTFKLAASAGGAAINLTDAGTGAHYLHTAPLKTSWYPRDFERELFIAKVDPDALLVGKRVDVRFGFETAILNKKTQAPRVSDKVVRAQWRLLIEWGTAASDSAPATTDANLRKINWNATPILDKAIFITNDTPAVSTFGARIKRTEASTFTVEKNLFGTWSASASAVNTADFFLRARLTQMDFENADDAEGFVVLLGLDRVISGDAGDVGKLIIR